LKQLVANSELVSRSQLLLQYLLAVDMTVGNNGLSEHSPAIAEARGADGDPECLA
jgi:hypothetical protein